MLASLCRGRGASALRGIHMRNRSILGCLLAAFACVAGLLVTGAPAQAISRCQSDNPPDSCFVVTDSSPVGALSSATRSPAGVTVSGWAMDADGGPVSVRVTVGGTTVGTLTANQPGGPNGQSDVFSGFVSVPSATGAVCATAINFGVDAADTSLGCSTLSVSHNPIGNLDSIQVVNGSIVFTGWAIDPDTASSVQVTLWYYGVNYGTFTANLSRPDVAAAYPGYGDAHGYRITIPGPYACPSGSAVTTLNVGAGSDTGTGSYICS